MNLQFPIPIFIPKVGFGRTRRVSSPQCKDTGLDLIIADIPENLPVPGISAPFTSVPPWNMQPESPFLSLVMRICMMTLPFFFFIVIIEHCTPKLKKQRSSITFAYARIGGELMTLPLLLQSSPQARYDTFFIAIVSYYSHCI